MIRKIWQIGCKFQKELKLDKIQAFERPTNENLKKYSDTEEFREELATPLHYEAQGEQSKIFKISTLIYPVPIQEQPPDDRHLQGYVEANFNPVDGGARL